jgi:hypothetical protein
MKIRIVFLLVRLWEELSKAKSFYLWLLGNERNGIPNVQLIL